MAPLKKNDSCFCGRACVYYLIRCDACDRGVHFACIGMTLTEAAQRKVFVCRECEGTAQEEDLAEQLKAQGRPGAVVFTTICHYHNAKTGRRRGTSTTSALVHRDEVLSNARCNVCDHRCNFKFIQCDKCKAWCHYACAEMTEELAASVDQWYCRPCLAKERAEKDRHSVVRQLKRYAEPTGSDHLRKKTRVDAMPSAFCATLASGSTLDDELELYLSDPSELELDFDNEPELKREEDAELELDLDDELESERGVKSELELYLSDASELELEFEDEPELKRKDDAGLDLDLEDQPELELNLDDDPELVLELEHECEPDLKREDDNELLERDLEDEP